MSPGSRPSPKKETFEPAISNAPVTIRATPANTSSLPKWDAALSIRTVASGHWLVAGLACLQSVDLQTKRAGQLPPCLAFDPPNRQDGRTLIDALEAGLRLGDGVNGNDPPKRARPRRERDTQALPFIRHLQLRRADLTLEVQRSSHLARVIGGEEIPVGGIGSFQVDYQFDSQHPRGSHHAIGRK